MRVSAHTRISGGSGLVCAATRSLWFVPQTNHAATTARGLAESAKAAAHSHHGTARSLNSHVTSPEATSKNIDRSGATSERLAVTTRCVHYRITRVGALLRRYGPICKWDA